MRDGEEGRRGGDEREEEEERSKKCTYLTQNYHLHMVYLVDPLLLHTMRIYL